MKWQKYKIHFHNKDLDLNFTAVLCHVVTQNHRSTADVGSRSIFGGKKQKTRTPITTSVAIPHIFPAHLSPFFIDKGKTPS